MNKYNSNSKSRELAYNNVGSGGINHNKCIKLSFDFDDVVSIISAGKITFAHKHEYGITSDNKSDVLLTKGKKYLICASFQSATNDTNYYSAVVSNNTGDTVLKTTGGDGRYSGSEIVTIYSCENEGDMIYVKVDEGSTRQFRTELNIIEL